MTVTVDGERPLVLSSLFSPMGKTTMSIAISAMK